MSNPIRFRFKLYIAGTSPKSERARENLKRIVDEHFDHDVEIEVVDLLERPQLAREDQIVAIPTLVRYDPAPRATVVGDLSDAEKVLAGVGAGRRQSSR